MTPSRVVLDYYYCREGAEGLWKFGTVVCIPAGTLGHRLPRRYRAAARRAVSATASRLHQRK